MFLDRSWKRLCACLLLLPVLGGCSWTWALHQQGATSNCPGTLVEPGQLEGDFVIRERQRIFSRGEEITLEIIAEKTGDSLVLVGLHRFGRKAFVLQQDGGAIRTKTYWGRPAIRPINVLRDLNRVHFSGIAGGLKEDGEHAEVRGDVEVHEFWSEGRLEKRVFSDQKRKHDPIEILYLGPKRVRIDNHRCNYRVESVRAN